MIRRVDDLGRIVIPKEIRRTLRMRESEPLEIFVDGKKGIILRKYAPFKSLEDYAPEYAASLHENLNGHVIVCDLDEVITGTGPLKREKGMPINPVLKEVMLKKEVAILKSASLAIDGEEYSEVAIAPIAPGGEVKGCVAIGRNKNFNQNELKSIEVAADFLGKLLMH